MRSFDPRRLGSAECDAWVAYYRRRWVAVLLAVVRMVRVGFGLSWPRTLYGARLVLRANQLWARVRNNDPDGARQAMRRFYALVAKAHGEPFDVDEAARLLSGGGCIATGSARRRSRRRPRLRMRSPRSTPTCTEWTQTRCGAPRLSVQPQCGSPIGGSRTAATPTVLRGLTSGRRSCAPTPPSSPQRSGDWAERGRGRTAGGSACARHLPTGAHRLVTGLRTALHRR
jgi:hypothetical protein